MTNNMSARTELLLGREGVARLKDSFVVLAGAGAVGGYALEGLVRAGVGRIRVIDADVFSESNLNRQILATKQTVGRSKTEVAAERARSINPDIVIEGVPAVVSEKTIPNLLEGEPDVLVDAIDTIEHKSALLRYAAQSRIPTFSSMGAALHLDPTKIKVARLKKTSVCPLAASLRSRLRDADTDNIICVYSEECPIVKPGERDEHSKSVLGSLPTIPAIFGMMLANEAIRFIVSKP